MRSTLLACVLALLAIPVSGQTYVLWDAPAVPVAGYAVRCRPAGGTYGVPVDAYRAVYYYVPESPGACQVASYDAAHVLGAWSPEAVNGAAPPPVTPPPTPTPQPLPPPSACDVTAGTDALGHVWAIAFGWTMCDGAYSLPGGGNLPGAHGDVLRFVNGVVYVHDDRDLLWYRWNEPALNWVLFGATAPSCTGTTSPPPLPPPPPPATTLKVAPKTCTVSDDKPDARTGWGVQFAVDGVNVGGRDTSSPYSRDFPYTPGPHVHTAMWTKTGVAAMTRTVTTQGCQ